MSLLKILSTILSSTADNSNSESSCVDEEQFGGVSLSALNKLAGQIRSGSVYTNGKYLYARFNTTSGRLGPSIQYGIENNKLRKMTYRDYPGQRYYPEDEFMDKANEQFYFE